MNDEKLRREAVDLIQLADSSSVILLLEQIVALLRPLHPDLPSPTQEFLKMRRILVQQQLEAIEQTDPARAAALQAVIDKFCQQYPFDYQ